MKIKATNPTSFRRISSLELLLLVLLPTLGFAQQPSVSLTAAPGLSFDAASPPSVSARHRDWLTDAFPLFLTPSQTVVSTITIDPTSSFPFPNYSGRLNLSATCCGIVGAPGLVSPGVSATVGERPVAFQNINIPAGLIKLLGMPGSQTIYRIPFDFVTVAGQPVQTKLNLTGGATPLPGDWIAAVRAVDATKGIDKFMDVLFTVLPAWPPDGPAPACTSGLQVLNLSPLDVYSWKASHLSATAYTLGITFSSGQKGLDINVHSPSTPLPSTAAIVMFKHNTGWHTGIRNENSHNCAASGPTRIVEAGNSTTFLITQADTTTLVFSKPTCRAFFLWCWGQVGLDDVVEFSEGPFWALFGGHQVDIETVGDWGDGAALAIGEIKSPH